MKVTVKKIRQRVLPMVASEVVEGGVGVSSRSGGGSGSGSGGGIWHNRPFWHSSPPVPQPPAPRPPAPAPVVPSSRQITIQNGDTLANLAIQHGTTVRELMRLNPRITDPNRITAGDILNLPPATPPPASPPPQGGNPGGANVDLPSPDTVQPWTSRKKHLVFDHNTGTIRFVNEHGVPIATFGATSGLENCTRPSHERYAVIPSGDWTIRCVQQRDTLGMVQHGVGFFAYMSPNFETSRSEIGIHPDGRDRGTVGCIGLTGSQAELVSFYNMLAGYLAGRDSITVKVKNTR